MKLKNYFKKKHFYQFEINNHFWVDICEYNGDYYMTLSSNTNPFDSPDLFDIEHLKLTGEETLSQAKKMIKDYFKSNAKTSNAEVVRMCYDELNYDEYYITLKNAKSFVSDMKKKLGLGNEFIMREFGIHAISSCAMYLGY